MDIIYILQELKPTDFHKEAKCLTLLFPKKIVIFLREWEDKELIWHVFSNKEHIDGGVDEEKETVKLLSNYIDRRFATKKQ